MVIIESFERGVAAISERFFPEFEKASFSVHMLT